MWDTSCLDWRSRLTAGVPLVPNLPLFEDEAARALRVFKRLRLPDVPGKPTMGEACGEWFFAIVETLFGAYDPQAGLRMIQEVFLLVPKKNSKTSNAAALMVTALIMNCRPEAEGLMIAPTKEIAGLAFDQAAGMIRADESLSALFYPQQHIRTITHRETGASIAVKAADADTITGSKSTYILIDETHVFANRANAAGVFVEIRGALAARPDGFLVQITTQSKTPPAGVFKAELQAARDVRDGKVRLPLLPVLYELPPEMSEKGGWKDRRTWPLVNPNLGRSVNVGFLERELVRAEREGPEQLALLASQHFNVEVGMALRADRWVGVDYWPWATDPTLTLETLLERSEVVVVGIDGGGLDDLLGLAVLGRERGTRRLLLWCRAWAHEVVLERRKDIAPLLKDFETDGDLIIVSEPGEDVMQVADLMEQIAESGLLAERSAVGVDPVGIAQIVDELNERDLGNKDGEAPVIVGISQGWKLSGAIKTAERGLKDRTLVHADQALMTWCVGNAKAEPKGNAVTITKAAAGSAKIDPLIASLDAVALMSMNPEARGSVYEDHGLTVI